MKTLRLLFVAALLAAVPVMVHSQGDLEGMVKVKSTRLDNVWLLPNTDLRTYTKVRFDPTEVAFRKNFQRDYNRSASPGRRIDDQEIVQMADRARTGFEEIFTKAYRDAGWQVVDQPGPDVLRLRTGVVNLYINAPEQLSAGRTRTYSLEAGEATFVIEVRDSVTGALLGRAIDSQIAGDFPGQRTSVTNIADFEDLFRGWARTSVRGLEELKAHSPYDPSAPRRK